MRRGWMLVFLAAGCAEAGVRDGGPATAAKHREPAPPAEVSESAPDRLAEWAGYVQAGRTPVEAVAGVVAGLREPGAAVRSAALRALAVAHVVDAGVRARLRAVVRPLMDAPEPVVQADAIAAFLALGGRVEPTTPNQPEPRSFAAWLATQPKRERPPAPDAPQVAGPFEPRVVLENGYVRVLEIAPGQFKAVQTGAREARSNLPTMLVTIEVDRAELRDVVEQIAAVSGANIVVGSDVPEGIPVSVRLPEMPWLQALNSVVKSVGMTVVTMPGGGFQVRDPDHITWTRPARTPESVAAIEKLNVRLTALNVKKVALLRQRQEAIAEDRATRGRRLAFLEEPDYPRSIPRVRNIDDEIEGIEREKTRLWAELAVLADRETQPTGGR